MKTYYQFSRFFLQCFLISIWVSCILFLQSCREVNEQTGAILVDALSETPTSSPTASPSQTPTPFKIKILAPTKRPVFDHGKTPTVTPNGTIYVYDGSYGYIPVSLENGFTDVINWYNSDDIEGDEKFTESLAFSPYSNQVAYLLKEIKGNLRELWVASIDLSDSKLVWTDTKNIFDYNPQENHKRVITIRWGPGEKFVIISIDDFAQKPKAQKNVVIDIQSGVFWETTDYSAIPNLEKIMEDGGEFPNYLP